MATWSYDPDQLKTASIHRMRFELGDTTFEPPELTAALCDEEYQAMMDGSPSWKAAKIACLRGILMKYAHQTDVSVNGISYSFAKRVDFWKGLLEELERKNGTAVPRGRSSGSSRDGGHYFHKNMHRNGWR